MKVAVSHTAVEEPSAEHSVGLNLPALAPAIEPAIDEEPAAGGLPAGVDLLERLETICSDQGLSSLAVRLGAMTELVAADLARFEQELGGLPRRPEQVGQAASHLMERGGKRLRPLCLALASRLGSGFADDGLDLAVAVELVHSATLLHDDVVDLSDQRRGSATARTVYGNAASIFAGDWLLVEALRRVRRSGHLRLLDQLLSVIEEMIFAESLQLENRGRLTMDRPTYFRVVEGKTASVFRWAMTAGGVAGGLGSVEQKALAAYGNHLGVTFQAVDDLLDLTGETAKTGKSLFTDLREGKMTLPLILALERRPQLRSLVERVLALPAEQALPADLSSAVVTHLHDSDAIADCFQLARDRSRAAVEALDQVPAGQARDALATVAEAIIDRDL